MQQIVECIPNFSDGRRPEVFNAIAASIRSVAGVRVLGVSSDADHNRTVVTFVGGLADVEEAAFRGIQTAAKLIDLDQHVGEHPRIGATDVCPFVPVRGVTMADCVALAHRLGRRVGEELGIAVYLYAEAAMRPERTRLAAIRRGEYEGWKAEIGQSAHRAPDYGPAVPRPWGATVIGARPFLIAYNLFLNSNDVGIADKIARGIRHSNGGLRYVQALGFLVEGQAQVSMNLTDFTKTPLHRVQEMVKSEAARYGLRVTRAELVGLIPQNALISAAEFYLQLQDMEDDQILEVRLSKEDADSDDSWEAPETFVEAVASPAPTPGGGSVAALAAALAAGLAEMMAGLTAGRKKYADANDVAETVLAQAAELRQQLVQRVKADADAFDNLMSAYRRRDLPEVDRAALIEQATILAAEVPLQVARDALQVARLSEQIVDVGNSNAVTDGATAAVMARASVQAAGMNVRINASGLSDQARVRSWRKELEEIESEVSRLATHVMARAADRGGFA